MGGSFYRAHFSHVLRNAFEVAGKQNLTATFSDDTLETSEIFTLFLRLLEEPQTQQDDLLGITEDLVAKVSRVGLFCRKWDCRIAYELLLRRFEDHNREDSHMLFQRFTLGALLDDPEVCAKAIQEYKDGDCDEPVFNSAWEGEFEAPMFFPQYWSVKMWERFSFSYAWALMQSAVSQEDEADHDDNQGSCFLAWLRCAKAEGNMLVDCEECREGRMKETVMNSA